MAEKLRLTAAELVLLVTTLDPQHDSTAFDLLGLANTERTDPIAAAGLGSLLVRGLAVADEERVQLAPDVAAIGLGLINAEHCLQIALLSKGNSDAAILVDAAQTRFLVTPLPHRCFEVTGLDAGVELAEPLAHIARQFLSQGHSRVVSVVFGATATASLTVAVDGAGRWTIIRNKFSDGISGLSQDEVFARFRAQITEMLASTS